MPRQKSSDKAQVTRPTPKPRTHESTDQLLTQMLEAGLDSRTLTRADRALVTAFSFIHSRVLRKALRDPEHGREMLMNVVALAVNEVGVKGTLDALAMHCFNVACTAEMEEVDRNAWRRAGNAVLDARKVARANEV